MAAPASNSKIIQFDDGWEREIKAKGERRMVSEAAAAWDPQSVFSPSLFWLTAAISGHGLSQEVKTV